MPAHAREGRSIGWTTVLSFLLVACLPPAAQADTHLVVVTSYPEDLTTRFEAAFERLHPDIDLQIVWKQSRDAAALLDGAGHGGADVYWAPSLDNFPRLAARGAFRPIAVDRHVLPAMLGRQPISDPLDRYQAFEVAGYGIVYSPERLRDAGLPVPRDWRDLTMAGWSGRLVVPQAGRVGFSAALYDVVLQSEGWAAGWATIAEMAGNADFATNGSQPTSAVQEGRAVASPTIDFFAASAKANGAPVDFVYPKATAFLPAWIAVLVDAPHPAAADAFVSFALSAEGQRLVAHADIGRVPVRADVTDPRIAETLAEVTFAYDFDLGRARRNAVVDLFEVMVVEPHDRTVSIWRRLHGLEERQRIRPDERVAAAVARGRAAAGLVPVSAEEAAQIGRTGADDATRAAWRSAIGRALDEAEAALTAGEGVP